MYKGDTIIKVDKLLHEMELISLIKIANKNNFLDDFMKVHDENSTMTISYSNGGIERMNILVI